MSTKLLSIVIPSYNSRDYMANCIESLLAGGDESLEILIVNDGSKDGTAQIADDYAARYHNVIRAIHQENRGHGGAINTGISHAEGLYLKVVDSDDRVDPEALKKVLQTLKALTLNNRSPVDLLVSNFIYDKAGARFKKTVRYRSVLPVNRIFGWEDVKPFMKGQYMLMHALTYRTGLLRDCRMKLPEHTFYVDNLFAFIPLNHVRKIYYLDVNLYLYYIGREDQSVNEKVMIGRIDQQLKINQIMIDHMLNSDFSSARLKRYMRHYLEIIMTVSSILLIRSRREEHLRERRELWHSVKYRDRSLYMKLRFGLLGTLTNLPGRAGRNISIGIYKLSRKAVGFN